MSALPRTGTISQRSLRRRIATRAAPLPLWGKIAAMSRNGASAALARSRRARKDHASFASLLGSHRGTDVISERGGGRGRAAAHLGYGCVSFSAVSTNAHRSSPRPPSPSANCQASLAPRDDHSIIGPPHATPRHHRDRERKVTLHAMQFPCVQISSGLPGKPNRRSNSAEAAGFLGRRRVGESLSINIVFGNDHVPHICNVLLPSLSTGVAHDAQINLINYDGLSGRDFNIPELPRQHSVRIIPNKTNRVLGFAESHNILFRECVRGDFFLILNPDCVILDGSIERLIVRMRSSGAAIVEGRQWPFEHPKEYDPLTLETPWASGAFCLIDSQFYHSIGGMDESYFLYMEDVDLSWQAWLHARKVVYEPNAPVIHFSGGPFYRADIISAEEYYSIRNFLLLSWKYFGEHGEVKALEMLSQHDRKALLRQAIADYKAVKADVKPLVGKLHKNIKITGVAKFHELR